MSEAETRCCEVTVSSFLLACHTPIILPVRAALRASFLNLYQYDGRTMHSRLVATAAM